MNTGYGYGYGTAGRITASVSVGDAEPYYVSSMPPEPLYESMTASPGYGYVWIDGYWHWNGYEWVWVSGRWERQQEGYVYVQPYYDYCGGSYVYTPGYWSRPDRVPHGLAASAITATVARRSSGRPRWLARAAGAAVRVRRDDPPPAVRWRRRRVSRRTPSACRRLSPAQPPGHG